VSCRRLRVRLTDSKALRLVATGWAFPSNMLIILCSARHPSRTLRLRRSSLTGPAAALAVYGERGTACAWTDDFPQGWDCKLPSQ